jgi:hypothetical protein
VATAFLSCSKERSTKENIVDAIPKAVIEYPILVG